MGELEKRMEYELNQAAYNSDVVWKAATEPGKHPASTEQVLTELIAPTLGAMRKAILELAREIDQMREQGEGSAD